jgi:UDP-N-acetyl-D-mannosaminuronic acid dehydrogenase
MGMEFNSICVIGLGYIGLPTASTLATHGKKVIGVDANPQVLSTLRKGGLHIQEPGLRTLVQAALGSGNLLISEKPKEADAFYIAVPTPFYDDKRADMRAVESASRSVVPYLRQGNLVMLESTSPPRTTIDLVAPILEKSGLRAGEDFFLAYSPERVLPGQILRELIDNARVIGGINSTSAEAGRDLYATFVRGDIFITDATTAEMVKLMENTYRDVNIAIANEFSRLAECYGVDVWEAIEYANHHPRVNILRPGPGVGGHCISIDPWFLVEGAPETAQLIKTARNVNDSQPSFVLDLIKHALGGDIKHKKIAILGLSYKPDVDDLRESPAIQIALSLGDEGALVTAFEPNNTSTEISGLKAVRSFEEAIKFADILVFLVGHTDFRNLNPEKVSIITPSRIVVDTIGAMSAESWGAAGFCFYRLGDGKSKCD